MANKTNCIFCRIAKGEIPSTIVRQDDRTVVFRDLNPQAPTHLLVIPRKHVGKAADLSPEDELLAGRLVLMAATVAREQGITDYRLVMNCGAKAGQSVFHLHLHLLAGRPFAWPPG